MTLKLHGIIEEPKEEVIQPKTKVKEEAVNTDSLPVESAGYLTPEETKEALSESSQKGAQQEQ
jgi:hypothetical protein